MNVIRFFTSFRWTSANRCDMLGVPYRRSTALRLLKLRDMIDCMQRCLGTKVTAIGKDNKGRIYVDYYTRDDIDRIYEILEKIEKSNTY